ncbi:MAG: hypothetical protein HY711_06845, partial [Candidatus Melainabacteria bacterium]|nr:hypothetical protein [Candidatus Melainabacteria bacterium]
MSAVFLFLAINVAAYCLRFSETQMHEYPEKTWSYWTIKGFVESHSCPDVVFLGSSLVLVPVAGADADYLNKRLDGSKHHRSIYFESTFRQDTGHAVKTFNLALPGEMPSDAYLITDFLLKGTKRPRMIIYGVGPRDFMDNLLPSPSATDPYRSLSRLADVRALTKRVVRDAFDWMNFELGQLVYLYGT